MTKRTETTADTSNDAGEDINSIPPDAAESSTDAPASALPPEYRPDAPTRRRIAVESNRCEKAVTSAYDGRAKPVTTRSVGEAAERIGVPPPRTYRR